MVRNQNTTASRNGQGKNGKRLMEPNLAGKNGISQPLLGNISVKIKFGERMQKNGKDTIKENSL